MCDFIYCKSVTPKTLISLKEMCFEFYKQNIGENNSGFGFLEFVHNGNIVSLSRSFKHFINDHTSKEDLKNYLRDLLSLSIFKEGDYNSQILIHFRKPTPRINNFTSDNLAANVITRQYIQPFIKMRKRNTYYMVHKGEISEFYDKVSTDIGSDSYLFFQEWPFVTIPSENDGPILILEKSLDKIKEIMYNDDQMVITEDFIYSR